MTFEVAMVLGIRSGIQERNQWVVLVPPIPPVEGIRCLGREEIPRIILGKSPIGVVLEIIMETSIVRLGGYSRGAGSKEAGMASGKGLFHGRDGLFFSNRRGYMAMRDDMIRAWHASSANVSITPLQFF